MSMEMACGILLRTSCCCSHMDSSETCLPLDLRTEMKLTRLLWSPHPILPPEVAPRQRDHFWQSQLQPAPIDMKLQHRLGHFETQKPVPPLALVAVAVSANPIMTAPMTSDFPPCCLRPR